MANRGLGTLTLDLVAKIGGFERGMDKAARHADKRMREMERRAKKFGKAIGTAISVGAVAFGAGMALYIRNTIEAEKVQAQLEARIKSTGMAAGLTLKDLNAMAGALQAATTFDDESIGEAQALLLTFTKIGKESFGAATEAVLNLSVAMKQGLKESAIQVGKALNDPILGVTALRRVGIQLSEQQVELIRTLTETGRVAEAQKVILAELETQMGGSARAARDTLGGALEGLKNSFNNLLEGDSGSDGVRGAVKAINDLNDTLNDPDVKQGVESIVSGLVRMASFALQGIAAFNGLAVAIRDAFSADSDKTYLGLLAKRAALEDKKSDPFWKPGSPNSLLGKAAGGTGAIDREIADLDKLIEARRKAMRGPVPVTMVTGRADFSGVTGGALGGWERPAAAGGGADPARSARDAERMREEILRSGEAITDMYRDQEDAQLELVRAEIARQESLGRLMGDMQFEIDLLGMSAIEQEKAIALRHAGVDAMSAEGQAITDLVEKMEGARDARRFIDDIQGAVTDFAASAMSGFSSVGDAFADMADRIKQIAINMLAEKAIQWLFNAIGNLMGGGAAGPSQAFASSFGNNTGWLSGGAGFGTGGGVSMPTGGGQVMGGPPMSFNTPITIEGGSGQANPALIDELGKRMQREQEATARRVLNEERRQGGLLWRMEQGR